MTYNLLLPSATVNYKGKHSQIHKQHQVRMKKNNDTSLGTLVKKKKVTNTFKSSCTNAATW